MSGEFAAIAIAMYVGHHLGDYWVQTDSQARHKGAAGRWGSLHCLAHVLTYMLTQWVMLVTLMVTGITPLESRGIIAGLFVSGATHYLADRREHGIMFRLARLLPGKANFLKLGVPRTGYSLEGTPRDDNPSLGTGAWALDQSWHIFWGVFVASVLMVVL